MIGKGNPYADTPDSIGMRRIKPLWTVAYRSNSSSGRTPCVFLGLPSEKNAPLI